MIHKFSQQGLYIVMDINSGAIHCVDEITYKCLDFITPPLTKEVPETLFENLDYSKEELEEAYSEIFELYEAEMLFTPDEHYNINSNVDSPIKALCLHISHDCNLRCKYCFASTGDFGEGRKLMPFEIGKAAIDFVIEKSGKRRNLEVDFFGGEPLMNFEVVKDIVEYARSIEKEHNKNFRFTITTNGVLLSDDKIDYINREMSNVVLSIDGRKSVNDKVRFRPDESGSYDKILPAFKKLVQNRPKDKDYYVRGTFTKYNLDFSEDVLHLYEEGFDQISIEPVVAPSDMDYALTMTDTEAIANEYEKLAKTIYESRKNGKWFNFFHFMVDLEQGPCAIKRMRGCGSGNEYVAVTPDGDIYPCHQFVGHQDFKMGSVLTGELNLDIKARFAEANIYNKQKCKECWARFFCSGGCNANNYMYEGDLLKPHELSCELEKKRVECAIALKIMESLDSVE